MTITPKEKRAVAAASPVELQAAVLQQFRVIFSAVKSHWRQVEHKSGIGGAQVWALSVIRQQPGIGVSELALALSVRQPTASYMVRCLTQQGLIEARREGPDKRAVQLHINAEGRKLLRRTPGPFAGVLPDVLAKLDSATLDSLQQHLAALVELLGPDADAATVPMGEL